MLSRAHCAWRSSSKRWGGGVPQGGGGGGGDGCVRKSAVRHGGVRLGGRRPGPCLLVPNASRQEAEEALSGVSFLNLRMASVCAVQSDSGGLALAPPRSEAGATIGCKPHEGGLCQQLARKPTNLGVSTGDLSVLLLELEQKQQCIKNDSSKAKHQTPATALL